MLATKTPMESKLILEKWEGLAIIKEEGVCNCDRCLQDRSKEHWESLVLLAYPAIGFVPRNRDIRINYNGYEQDAMFVEPRKALSLTLTALKRLRTSNRKLRAALPKADRSQLVHCYDCGMYHSKKTGMKFKDKWLCISCAERYEICTDCGELTDRHSVYSVNIKAPTPGERSVLGEHYRFVCNDCLTSYGECHNCGTWSKSNSLVRIPYTRNNDNVNTYDVCQTCFSMHGVKCYECGRPTMPRIGQRVSETEAFCPQCTEERGGIQNHNYQPLVQRFHKGTREGSVSDKALYFGFELELDTWKSSVNDNNAMAHMIKDQIGTDRIYLVHDGTIARDTGRRDGCEVVSHPFTWDRYKNEDKIVWDKLLTYCRMKGWKSNTPQCGIHVHTTKAAWGTLQIYKLLQFMYNKKNKKFVTTIAQRKPNKYCAMSEKDYDEAAYVAKMKKNRDRQHYNIVNLNNKRGGDGKTIEFRMFRGTLEPLYFHKNIEFVHAIYHYTRDYPRSKMTDKGFISFVGRMSKTYPHLHEFITKGGK